jgi:hypothetical protein
MYYPQNMQGTVAAGFVHMVQLICLDHRVETAAQLEVVVDQ